MFQALQALAVLLVAVGMALPLAHALELPGKLRLARDAYLTVQSIYYPGFTVAAAFGEFGGIVATFVLLVCTPLASVAFWLTLVALVALLVMHALYWVLTHPVNRFWLKDQNLKGAGATFFAVGGKDPGQAAGEDWTVLRDRWEYSHVARAAFAVAGLVALCAAVTF